MRLDRWDALGAGGAALIATGVWRLAGWPWTAIFVGVLVVAIYLLHEAAMRRD